MPKESLWYNAAWNVQMKAANAVNIKIDKVAV